MAHSVASGGGGGRMPRVFRIVLRVSVSATTSASSSRPRHAAGRVSPRPACRRAVSEAPERRKKLAISPRARSASSREASCPGDTAIGPKPRAPGAGGVSAASRAPSGATSASAVARGGYVDRGDVDDLVQQFHAPPSSEDRRRRPFRPLRRPSTRQRHDAAAVVASPVARFAPDFGALLVHVVESPVPDRPQDAWPAPPRRSSFMRSADDWYW